jgi:hypothetical protein
MDLKKYYSDIRAVEATLPPQKIYYLVSLDNPDKNITGGRVLDVATARQAAELIVGRTHRPADPADIERFRADEKRLSEEYAAAEYKRRGNLAMPEELQELVRMAIRNVDPATPEKKKKGEVSHE